MEAAVITVSDRASAGVYEDLSGPFAADRLREGGFEVANVRVVPDSVEQIRGAIEEALAAGAQLIVTTGGTGVGPRDVTPEATKPFFDRELPHLVSAIVARGLEKTIHAVITRGLAGVCMRGEGALIVNVPGSTGGVKDAMGVLVEVAPHILDQLSGGDH